MSRSRQSWSHARNRILERMADLRMTPVDVAHASGISEKHIRTLLANGTNTAAPRTATQWKLCDALGWSQDSIDRLMAGEEPLIVDSDQTPANVKRLPNPIDSLAVRLTRLEHQADEGIDQVADNEARLDELTRLVGQLAERVDRLDQRSDGAAGEP